MMSEAHCSDHDMREFRGERLDVSPCYYLGLRRALMGPAVGEQQERTHQPHQHKPEALYRQSAAVLRL